MIEQLVSLALWIMSAGFLLAGSAFAIISGIGIVRLPEFYSRMHGSGINDTLGASLIIFGLLLQADSLLVAYKLLAIMFFLLVTSPSSSHALAHSALSHGVQPILDVKSKWNDQSEGHKTGSTS